MLERTSAAYLVHRTKKWILMMESSATREMMDTCNIADSPVDVDIAVWVRRGCKKCVENEILARMGKVFWLYSDELKSL